MMIAGSASTATLQTWERLELPMVVVVVVGLTVLLFETRMSKFTYRCVEKERERCVKMIGQSLSYCTHTSDPSCQIQLSLSLAIAYPTDGTQLIIVCL